MNWMWKKGELRRVVWLTRRWPANEWQWMPTAMPDSHSFLHNDAKSDIRMGHYGSDPFHSVKCFYISARAYVIKCWIAQYGEVTICLLRACHGSRAKTTKKPVWVFLHLTECFNTGGSPWIKFLQGIRARDSSRTYGFYCSKSAYRQNVLLGIVNVSAFKTSQEYN